MRFWRSRVKVIVLLVFTLSLSTAVFAESRVSLRGQAPYRKAELEVSLNENIYYGGKNRIEFSLKALEPKATYSIWLEKGSQSKGLGNSPHSFIADTRGRAAYTSEVEAYKLGSWQIIKIVRHKDSVPENRGEENLETVFIVDIGEFLSGKKVGLKSQSSLKPKITIYKGPLNIE